MTAAHSSLPSSSHSSSVHDAPSISISTRPRFNADLLRASLTTLLPSRLKSASWDKADGQVNRKVSKGLADEIKARMLDIGPTGFKYIVQVQLVENLGQGGRADSACHWEQSDLVVAEMFSNDSIICTVLAYAIRSSFST